MSILTHHAVAMLGALSITLGWISISSAQPIQNEAHSVSNITAASGASLQGGRSLGNHGTASVGAGFQRRRCG